MRTNHGQRRVQSAHSATMHYAGKIFCFCAAALISKVSSCQDASSVAVLPHSCQFLNTTLKDKVFVFRSFGYF